MMAGIHKTKSKIKTLEELLDKQTENLEIKNQELLKTKRELKEITIFMDFVRSQILKNDWQLCELKQFNNNKYIAFFLKSQFEQEPQYVYNYTLIAYLSSDTHCPVYKGNLDWKFTKRFDIPREFHISSQSVTEQYQNNGIGTQALDIIKHLARQLQCDKITGRRVSLNKFTTEEDKCIEEKKLYQFYQKNGFTQSEKDETIEFLLKSTEYSESVFEIPQNMRNRFNKLIIANNDISKSSSVDDVIYTALNDFLQKYDV